MAKGFSFEDDDDDIDLDVGSDSGAPARSKPVTHRAAPTPKVQRPVTRRPANNAPPALPVANNERHNTAPQPVRRPSGSTAASVAAQRPAPVRPAPEPARPAPSRPAPVQRQAPAPPSRPVTHQPPVREEPARSYPTAPSTPAYTPSYDLPQVDPHDPIDHDAIPEPASRGVEVHEEQVVPFDPTPSLELPEEPEYIPPTPVFEPEAEPDTPVVLDKKKMKKGAKARPAPRQKDKASKRKPASSDSASSLSGGRGGALAIRWTVVGLLGVLAFTGGYKVLFPTAFPSPTQVTNVVRTNLGMTEFPTERADGFVTAFTKAYLTYTPGNTDVRNALLRNYAADSILTNFNVVIAADSPNQEVTAGPFISGVKSKSDTAAVFTVASEVNGQNWIYVDVPVYYDKVTESFAVSGSPSFVSAPPQAMYPGTKDTRIQDNDASVEAKKDLETFLASWAASDTNKIALSLTEDASNSARYGLRNTVIFSSITQLVVFEASKDVGSNPNEREAQVQVQWQHPGSEQTLFTQTYDMVIMRNSNNTWTVKDIQGGVPSSQGGGVPQSDNAAIDPSGTESQAPQAEPGD